MARQKLFDLQPRKGFAAYGWIVDKEPWLDEFGGEPVGESVVGLAGPRNIDPEVFEALKSTKKGQQWKLYDDDGVLMFTGRIVAHERYADHEGVIAAPLNDWGAANGCTRLVYPGHPEWEIS